MIHPILSGESEQIARCVAREFLKNNNLNFFGYDRVYQDGRCFRISTDLRVTEYLHQRQAVITAPIPSELIQKQIIYLVPEELSTDYDQFRRSFKIGHVVDFIEIKNRYYEQFWMFGELDIQRSANFYLNKKRNIFLFLDHFLEE